MTPGVQLALKLTLCNYDWAVVGTNLEDVGDTGGSTFSRFVDHSLELECRDRRDGLLGSWG